jgi:hypothetical protein
MQVFWNAGTDVPCKTWPFIAGRDLFLVDGNQRPEERSIDCVINEEYLPANFQPAIEFSQARPNAIAIEEVNGRAL